MRRVLGAAVVAVVCLVGVACQPTEPAMTINATAFPTPECQDIDTVSGSVNPDKATPRVVLQKSSGGQWQDWVGPNKAGGTPVLLADTVSSTGNYSIRYMVPRTTNTIKLRVRSDGGTRFSPTFYVTPWSIQPGRCA